MSPFFGQLGVFAVCLFYCFVVSLFTFPFFAVLFFCRPVFCPPVYVVLFFVVLFFIALFFVILCFLSSYIFCRPIYFVAIYFLSPCFCRPVCCRPVFCPSLFVKFPLANPSRIISSLQVCNKLNLPDCSPYQVPSYLHCLWFLFIWTGAESILIFFLTLVSFRWWY